VGGCPLDLHRLIPIPDAVLALGEDAPAAPQWLWMHWGTTHPLRQVRVLAAHGDRRLRRSARVIFEFLSADWTPGRRSACCGAIGQGSSSPSTLVTARPNRMSDA
jgi:hypothetical protein